MIVEQINPRFRFGESNENFCDCAGLIILLLKQKGLKCVWEKEIIRQPTNWFLFQEQLTRYGFSRSKQSNYPVVVWKNPDQTAHIGVLFQSKIYHMMPNGIQIRQYEGEQIWFYCGD